MPTKNGIGGIFLSSVSGLQPLISASSTVLRKHIEGESPHLGKGQVNILIRPFTNILPRPVCSAFAAPCKCSHSLERMAAAAALPNAHVLARNLPDKSDERASEGGRGREREGDDAMCFYNDHGVGSWREREGEEEGKIGSFCTGFGYKAGARLR